MDANSFYNLPLNKLKEVVGQQGPKVVVFPINGTRRWYVLEYQSENEPSAGNDYLNVIADRHIELYKLIFDHGIETLLTPCFGPDLLVRGTEYLGLAAEGLAQLATHPKFLDFFHDYQVRVKFYGDYRRFFAEPPYTHLAGLFDEVATRTASYQKHRLFFGLFANDATETIAQISVEHYRQQGHTPNKQKLIETYYGEYIDPVDIFIGFDKFSAFDMPLIATGGEDLYFTVSPSPYLTAMQFREILYDHLYARRKPEPDYIALQDLQAIKNFYRTHIGHTLGVGIERNGIWYPQLQIKSIKENPA